jgi:hypothetical protein
MVKKTESGVLVDQIRYIETNLKVYMDIVHVDKEMFLVSAVDPLN